jgi:anti-anti-sigma factor
MTHPVGQPGPVVISATSWPDLPGPGFETFVLSADLGEASTRIGLRGELDAAAAPSLAAALMRVVDNGVRRLVLDLRELVFLDAAGLGVIVGASMRLSALGGVLTVRSPSPMARRIFDVTGLAGLVQPATPDAVREERTVEHSQPRILVGAGIGAGRSAQVSSLPSGDAIVDGALRLVVALARATVGGADGVSVSLRRNGRLATVAASDQTILDMDAGQYATGQGPCVDASVEGERFLTEALATEQRWPDFTPKARALGINAIMSSPLLAGARPIGALNIYARTAEAFAPEDQELASMFADQASIILTEAGLDATDEHVAIRFRQALRSREVIAQAQGVLMERSGVDEAQAFALLRRFSVGTNTALEARAIDVVESTRRLTEPPTRPSDEVST